MNERDDVAIDDALVNKAQQLFDESVMKKASMYNRFPRMDMA